MRDTPCTVCGRLIERWGTRWRHKNRLRYGPHHTAIPPESREET